MIRFLIILVIVLIPLFLTISSYAPELANYFGLLIFALFGLYLFYRIPLEIFLHYKKEEVDEDNKENFDRDNVKILYDLDDYKKARDND